MTRAHSGSSDRFINGFQGQTNQAPDPPRSNFISRLDLRHKGTPD